ncbi:hypothetical protein BFAG_00260 [Bacteroides fragilis 3_1_12]|uniref:Uncharacterized protein n=1 Tax=Bacteroides fragilis 3_1_12 TaxID=457424 RepID=A0ABN0BFA1_BACFG|nr:hypothetical protein BFAG_00260 [Bacteroides fragilis 3_1_12]
MKSIQSARFTDVSNGHSESGIFTNTVLASCALTAKEEKIPRINTRRVRVEFFISDNLVSLRSYLVPKYRNIIPINTRIRSIALLFKFFSRNIIAPKRKDTMTLPLRTIETIEIIESS